MGRISLREGFDVLVRRACSDQIYQMETVDVRRGWFEAS
jgi:hypothetical protein